MKIEGTRFKLIRKYSDYPSKNSKKRTRMYELKCECGSIVHKPKCAIINGNTKSCGCLNRELAIKRNTKHNLRKEECSNTFYSMHRRCYNPKHSSYKNYGGRGIKVCQEWHDIKNFVKWCKDNGYKKGLQLDRINNDKDYSPSNCRFVTPKDNLRNTRRNVYVNGMILKDYLNKLSRDKNISFSTLVYRYYRLKEKGIYPNEENLVNYKK